MSRRIKKAFVFIILFMVLLIASSGCISKSDLYGNWNSPQSYGKSHKIYTENYAVTFIVPGKYYKKSRVVKARYEVKNYGLFLRVKSSSGLTDNVFNIFGFIYRDRTRYWLGFLPIFGFQYSYKISDEEMLCFLRKHKFTLRQVIDVPILTNREFIPDHSAPSIMNKLKE